jgi:hypothetical protein
MRPLHRVVADEDIEAPPLSGGGRCARLLLRPVMDEMRGSCSKRQLKDGRDVAAAVGSRWRLVKGGRQWRLAVLVCVGGEG